MMWGRSRWARCWRRPGLDYRPSRELWIGTIGASFTILPVLFSPVRSLVSIPDGQRSHRTRCSSRRSAWRRSAETSRMRSLWPHGGLWGHPDFLKPGLPRPSAWSGRRSRSSRSRSPRPRARRERVRGRRRRRAEFLPFLLFALPAGVWVDRLRRKPILVIADVGRGLALATIPLSYAFDALTIWQLYIVGFRRRHADSVLRRRLPVVPAVPRQPGATRRRQLEAEVSRSAASLAGPASPRARRRDHGAVRDPRRRHQLPHLGRLLLAIRRREPARTAEDRSMRKELVEGLRYLLGHPLLEADRRSRGTVERFRLIGGRSSSSTPYASSTCPRRSSGSCSEWGTAEGLFGAMVAGRLAGTLGVGKTTSAPRSCSARRGCSSRWPRSLLPSRPRRQLRSWSARCRRLQCDGDQVPTSR